MIWDRILDEGQGMGIIPCRFTTLDMLRTESYLLFFPFDNSEMYPFENEGPGDTLWELGLDFTVSPGKTGFRGAEEHYRLKGKERFKIWGLKLEGKNVPGNGAPVFQGRQAGRRGDAGDVFAAEQLEHRHCPPAGRLRQQRHQAGSALRHPWPDQGHDPFDALLRRRKEAPHRQGLTRVRGPLPRRVPASRNQTREDQPDTR